MPKQEKILTVWVCNKNCGEYTLEKPEHKNTTCEKCISGRYKSYKFCEYCGDLFEPQRLSQSYCQKQCAYDDRENKESPKKGKRYPHLDRARIETCKNCGDDFKATDDYETENGKRKQKYCSQKCFEDRTTKEQFECENCENEFKLLPSSRQKGRYCSRGCAHEDMRGEKAARWEGGKTKKIKLIRESKEYADWRQQVFERDDYQCVNCGRKSGNGKSVELHADHIKPISKYPELATKLSNGRTLCVDCHKQTKTWGPKEQWPDDWDEWENLTGQEAERIPSESLENEGEAVNA